MFGGRWEVKYDPVDGSVFIDRDPAMFGLILDYLRVGTIDLSDLTPSQRSKLDREADFYQISSLMCLINPPTFSLVKNKVTLSHNNTIEQISDNSYTLSSTPFSPTSMEKKVKILKGNRILIGVAPLELVETEKSWSDCGFYVYSLNGELYSQNNDDGTNYKDQAIEEGSIVTVKLDVEFNVSFAVNGEDWGTAFPNIAEDHSKPLHLAVVFSFDSTNRNVVWEGQVEMLS